MQDVLPKVPPPHGFSDSTPRAGSDRIQKSEKRLLSALQLMHSNAMGGSLRNHSDQ